MVKQKRLRHETFRGSLKTSTRYLVRGHKRVGWFVVPGVILYTFTAVFATFERSTVLVRLRLRQ